MILQGVIHKKRRRRYQTPKLKFIVLGNFSLLIFFLAGFNFIMVGASLSTDEKPVFHTVKFSLCDAGPRHDCVMDADTFYLGYQKFRVANIDTPENYSVHCAYEEELGGRATKRFVELLNYGPFFMRTPTNSAEDASGQKLRTLHRKDQSLGAILVSEGLAREWTGQRQPWCT